MTAREVLLFIGCELIPTPPSPCADFGGQFLLSLAIGLIAPDFLVRPVYIVFNYLGKFIKLTFGRIPVIKKIVEGAELLLDKFFELATKERESDNIVLSKIYTIFLREDLIERIVFGYFVTTLTGSISLTVALLM